MPTLPIGAFDRGLNVARRGFNRSGLGQALGQGSSQRRALTSFGGGGFGASSGARRDFSGGGVLGDERTGRSAFGGRSLKSVFSSDDTAYGSDGLFGGVQWDSETGLQIKGGASGGTGGGGGPSGDPAIDAAALARGVPPAVLRALVNRESSGNWGANNRTTSVCDNAGVCRRKPDGSLDMILPYVGIFETTAQSWGLDWNAMVGNQQAQLNGMATIIGGIKQQQGFDTWGQAAAYYFGGPNSTQPGWADENGMTVAQYEASFNADLASYGGGSGGSSGGGGWSSALWGGASAPITYEFNAQSVNGNMYNYGSAHGTNGNTHPGVDVGVARGTTLYAARSGTVSCVGEADAGIGGTGGGSCGHFTDEGGGVGNVTIKFDDGSFLIYGHSQSAFVTPGQRVTAGQAVATSGGMLGAHTHFEYRVPGQCDSSYCVADPRQLGTWGGGGGGGGGTTPAPAQGPQAVNGAYYTPGYVIPARIPR